MKYKLIKRKTSNLGLTFWIGALTMLFGTTTLLGQTEFYSIIIIILGYSIIKLSEYKRVKIKEVKK